MKAYLITTGTIFGLVGIAHLVRLFVEEHPLSDASFLGHNLALFVIGVAIATWALRLLVTLGGHPPNNRSRGP